MTAGCWVSTRVVVDEDQRRCIQIKSIADHFSRMHLHAGNGAFPHDPVSKQSIARIQKENSKHFACQLGHIVMQIGEQLLGSRNDGAGQGFTPKNPAQCARQVSEQIGNVCRPTRHLHAFVLKTFEHTRQCSECIDQVVANMGCAFTDQAANECGKKAFVLVQFCIRLRDLFVATTRMISCR